MKWLQCTIVAPSPQVIRIMCLIWQKTAENTIFSVKRATKCADTDTHPHPLSTQAHRQDDRRSDMRDTDTERHGERGRGRRETGVCVRGQQT